MLFAQVGMGAGMVAAIPYIVLGEIAGLLFLGELGFGIAALAAGLFTKFTPRLVEWLSAFSCVLCFCYMTVCLSSGMMPLNVAAIIAAVLPPAIAILSALYSHHRYRSRLKQDLDRR